MRGSARSHRLAEHHSRGADPHELSAEAHDARLLHREPGASAVSLPNEQRWQPSTVARGTQPEDLYRQWRSRHVHRIYGEASETLELGYRTAPDRSIKTEILFPLQRDITLGGLFDRVEEGNRTQCAACHTAERFTNHEAFPQGVYESSVLVPQSVFTVDLESLRAEEAACDPVLESNRCGMLDAFFDYGEVQPSSWPGTGSF